MTEPPELWPYDAVGDSQAAPVVFLHGFMGRGRDWMPIAHLLGERAYAILLDLPGHGQNINRDLNQPLTFESLAAELAELLEYLNIKKVDLVGYSMGGRLAIYFALHYPDKIRRLVLESANPGIVGEKEREERRAKDGERAEEILTHGMGRFVDDWYRMPLFDTLKGYGERFEGLKAARKENDPRWMAKAIRELSPGNQPQVWDQLSQLETPVRLIAGAKDEKYVKLTHKMAKAMPHASVAILEDAGHNCHFEVGEAYTDVLGAFLGWNAPRG